MVLAAYGPLIDGVSASPMPVPLTALIKLSSPQAAYAVAVAWLIVEVTVRAMYTTAVAAVEVVVSVVSKNRVVE